MTHQTISSWNDDFAKSCIEKDFAKSSNFKPPIYNAWNTQESIAEEVEIGVATVNEVVNSFGKTMCRKFEKTFEPMLYATWKQHKQESIAEEVGVDRATVIRTVESVQKYMHGKMHKISEPMLYTTWKQHKQDNAEKNMGENVDQKAKMVDFSESNLCKSQRKIWVKM